MGNKNSQSSTLKLKSQARSSQSNFEIKNSRTHSNTVIKLDFMISSIAITNQNTHYSLHLKLHTLSECYMTCYFYLLETTNSQLKTHSKFEKANPSSKVINFKCPKFNSLLIPNDYLNFQLDELKAFSSLVDTNTKTHYPLVIEMVLSKVQNRPPITSSSTSTKLSKTKAYSKLNKQMNAFTQNLTLFNITKSSNGLYQVSRLFGIESTIFNNEWNPNTQQNKECVICFTQFIDTVLLPCRHMCTCSQCTNHIFLSEAKQCPLCRKDINNFLCISYKNQEKLKELQTEMELKKKELEEMQKNMIHLNPPDLSPNNIELNPIQRPRQSQIFEEEAKSLIDNQFQQKQEERSEIAQDSAGRVVELQMNQAQEMHVFEDQKIGQEDQQNQENKYKEQDQDEVEIIIQEEEANEQENQQKFNQDNSLNANQKQISEEDQKNIEDKKDKMSRGHDNQCGSSNPSNLIVFDE